MRGRLRLTWIELAIVAVILGVGTTVAGADRASRRRERRIEENEAAAIATLRLIAEAQEQFKAIGIADIDRDGLGEYGVFRELSGTIAARTSNTGTNTGGAVLAPPLLPHPFGSPGPRHAEVRREGYLFKVFLPGAYGAAAEECALGTADTLKPDVHYNLAEVHWCVYAWPRRRGRSGRRTFFVNQSGIVSATDTPRDWRLRRIDANNAGRAFVAGENGSNPITGTQALGTVGRDGNFWQVVE